MTMAARFRDWLKALSCSIDRSARMTVLNWGFLLVGLIAYATHQLPIIWLAWLGAAAAYLLRDGRPWRSALLFALFSAMSVGLYVWIDVAFTRLFDWSLPFSGDYLSILPSSGVFMEFVLAIAAAHGRYIYRHEPWQIENPFSQAYVPMELKRRRAEEEAERQSRTIDLERL